MLKLIALAAALFAAPVSAEPQPLPPVIAAVAFGAPGEVLLVHSGRSSTLVHVSTLVILAGPVSPTGFPALAFVAGGGHVHVFRYDSALGSHEIRTDCANYNSDEACAKAHLRMIGTMQRLAPRV